MDIEFSSCDTLQSTSQHGSSGPRSVPLEYLRKITNNFSADRLLGEGGFGTVYMGLLPNGETVAVKKLNSSMMPGVKDKQFENEAYHLKRLKHPNIVLLVGWCSETENTYVEYNGKHICAEKLERLLCLEYMPKGNLRMYLSDESSGLTWETRYKIIEGICYGLHYLHKGRQLNAPIVHMDLKPANILLDNNMVPKIADFGLSRLFSEEKTWTCTISRDGTLGYMAPEYLNRGLISTNSDIFSLGVIIIEIVTGRRDYPDETGISSQEFIDLVLKNWRHRLQKSQSYTSLEIDYQQIVRCIQIGLDCVKLDRLKRPTISQVIKMLHETESVVQSQPTLILGQCVDDNQLKDDSELPNRRTRSSSDKMLTADSRVDDNLSNAKSLENGEDSYKPRGTISLPSNQVQAEWIEQHEPGVYITLTEFRDGTRYLKRVQFSRRRFGEHQAENWWAENREKVYERYNVKCSDRVSSAASTAKKDLGDGVTQRLPCDISSSTDTCPASKGKKDLGDGVTQRLPCDIPSSTDTCPASTVKKDLGDGVTQRLPCDIPSSTNKGHKLKDDSELPNRRTRSSSDKMLTADSRVDDNLSNAKSLENGEDSYKPRGTISLPKVQKTTMSLQSNQAQTRWIERYEPGIYITLANLGGGTLGLKMVHFSRRRFEEHQAENWWTENRDKVYERYSVNVKSSEFVSSAASTAKKNLGDGVTQRLPCDIPASTDTCPAPARLLVARRLV